MIEVDFGLELKSHLKCSKDSRFEVLFERHLLQTRMQDVAQLAGDGNHLIVSTPTVWSLYGDAMKEACDRAERRFSVKVLPLTEQTKILQTVQQLCADAYELKLGRRSSLIAFGGGVCSDVVGFAASMIKRGVSHIRIPTTLIGQIDAGIGLKCGVNLGAAKNYCGAFYSPKGVFVDPALLASLEEERIVEGFAEIIKIALVRDERLFETIEIYGSQLLGNRFQRPLSVVDAVLHTAAALMLEELEIDPYETGRLERLVDMGHTFSPALEGQAGYSISHGFAVAVDMALSTAIAARLGICAQDDAERLYSLLHRIGLPLFCPIVDEKLCEAAMASAILHRNGRLNLVVPCSIGEAIFLQREDLPTGVIKQAIRDISLISDAFGATFWPSGDQQSPSLA